MTASQEVSLMLVFSIGRLFLRSAVVLAALKTQSFGAVPTTRHQGPTTLHLSSRQFHLAV